MKAKERQLAALKKGAAPVQPNPAERNEGQARDHAAKAVGVGHTLIDQAEAVMKKAAPEVAFSALQRAEGGAAGVQAVEVLAAGPLPVDFARGLPL